MIRVYVVGNKTSKSLSPLIFNHWFKKYKIKAKYYYLEIGKRDFKKTTAEILNKKEAVGLNVTIPYKKEIIKVITSIDAHAKNIGAVNCVYKKNKKTLGTNTDWIGYKKSTKNLGTGKSKTVLILGGGGAAKAILYSFVKTGHKNIYVFNRTKKQLKINNKNFFTKSYSSFGKYAVSANLIINTTPTNPLSKKQCEKIKESTIVSDVVYKPKETRFLKSFKNNKKAFGISMLLYQAVPCFKIWFGFEPKIDKKLISKLNKKIL